MEEILNKDILDERKNKVIHFLKNSPNTLLYFFLAVITFLGIFIRTRNISGLKDITTGGWTLGPDLDPFLFLRWAKNIAEEGTLFLIDNLRSVPLAEFCSGNTCRAVSTAAEMKLLSYMMVYFYKFLSLFGLSNDITYSSIIFPVFMFALTTIAFFLFARKIFYKQSDKVRNSIAIISTLFFVLIPSLLPRTIAGIPEKESVAFFFMFLAFYFFLEAFSSDKLKRGILFGVFAGISTALMALVWGGVIFIFFTIPTAFLLAFLLGKIGKKEFVIYASWLIVSFLIMIPFSERYTLMSVSGSLSTGLGSAVLIITGLNFFIIKNNFLDKIRRKIKLPKFIFSFVVSVLILMVVVSILFGPGFIWSRLDSAKDSLIEPQPSRFGLTVAENKQPYFTTEWKSNFGPVVWNIPLFFWLFFIGSVALFNSMIEKLSKRERIILTFGYVIFLICMIFSRYSSNHLLDGTSLMSHIVYFGGVFIFIGIFLNYYFKRSKEESFLVFKEFNFAYILYFIILTLGIIGSRSAIRLIMVLGAISPIAVGFLIVKVIEKYLKEKEDTKKLFAGILILIIVFSSVFVAWNYYKENKTFSENFVPGAYQWQWQKAMSWVRENTPNDAVFAHWWDYGYWVQSIGERATILDGGNAIVYWDYLMGRHVLTSPNEIDALEFLYTHKATHLLIDSTDIGKYTAFSSIGSDENYDRFSWINTFLMDSTQTQESKTETKYIYYGGTATDEDIVWYNEGKEIFLPAKSTGIGAFFFAINSQGEISQPIGIFVYSGKQYQIPLKYAYYNNKLYNFENGLDSGIFIFPSIEVGSNSAVSKNDIGALMFLSKRTIHSQLVRLYLFNEKSEYFKIAHTEPSIIIQSIEQQGLSIGDFVYYQGFNGPIKIWEINYPLNIKSNPDYLQLDYPNKELEMAKSGQY